MEILVWKVRKEKNISLQELSQKSGVSIGGLSDIENNKVSPRVNTLEKIADALEVDISALMRKQKDKKN